MKLKVAFLLCCVHFVNAFSQVTVFQRAEYLEHVKAAEKCMKKKDFSCAIGKYKAAFRSTKGHARSEDAYNLAASFAQVQQKDSAFNWLGIIADKHSFRDHKKIGRDKKFKSLHADPRWDSLLVRVMRNKTEFEGKQAEMDARVREAKKKQKEMLGKPAPLIACADIDGNKFETEQLKGKVVVLNFWATWCGPCRREMPALNKVREEFRGKDVVFLSFCSDVDSTHLMRKVLEKMPLNYNVVIAPDSRTVGKAYAVVAVPMNVVIDKKGKVVFLEEGYAEWVPEEMRSKIETSLAE